MGSSEILIKISTYLEKSVFFTIAQQIKARSHCPRGEMNILDTRITDVSTLASCSMKGILFMCPKKTNAFNNHLTLVFT
jgi:hypothetical protein